MPFNALGGQPGFDPNKIDKFVDHNRIAVLAYIRQNGRPNQAPIWYTQRDGVFYMTTVTDGPKHRALRRNPEVSFTIQDERPPYKALIADGTVSLEPLDHDNDPTEGMAVRYFGRVGAAAYDKLTRETYETSGLTLISLVPDEIKGFDNTNALSTPGLLFVRLRERLPVPRSWI